MSYIIKRTKGNVTEFYMNLFRIDSEGEFREPFAQKGINLPYEYDTMERAMRAVSKFIKDEKPGWSYSIQEYLR